MSNCGDYLIKLISIAGKYQYLSRCLKGHGKFSSTEIYILDIIAENNKINMKDISQMMATTKSATTQIVNKLYEREYITRVSDSSDRRRTFIELTAKGKDVHKAYIRCRTSIVDNICKNINLKKKQLPEALIKNLIEGLKENLKSEREKSF